MLRLQNSHHAWFAPEVHNDIMAHLDTGFNLGIVPSVNLDKCATVDAYISTIIDDTENFSCLEIVHALPGCPLLLLILGSRRCYHLRGLLPPTHVILRQSRMALPLLPRFLSRM